MKVIKEVIVAANEIGLFVRVCVSDMGAANRDLWKHVGITSTRTALQTSILHPCKPAQRLYFMADVPHLLKSIRNCLLTQSIILPDSVVCSANLTSNVVSLQPVKDLISMQDSMALKMAHKLKDVHVNPGNFQKMKVSYAAQVLSHSTASALKFCVDRKVMPSAALTTAWFLELINRWFDNLNARYALPSLFASSTVKIEELNFVTELFHDLHFSGQDTWKPIQTGVRLSTQAALDLYRDLVVNGAYKFLMTGRLTQDCVENLFSQIRAKGDSHPSPVHFRHAIRLISISQFMHVSQNSSYENDDGVPFLDFIKSKSSDTRHISNDDEDDVELDRVCETVLPLSECESSALYTVAGWAVFKEKSANACQVCLASIVGDAGSVPQHSQLTTIKSFEAGGGLTHPSLPMWQAIVAAKSIFRCNEDRLTKIDNVKKFLLDSFESQVPLNDFPACHSIALKVVSRYLRLRLHIHAAQITRKFASSTQFASRSAHCRTAVT